MGRAPRALAAPGALRFSKKRCLRTSQVDADLHPRRLPVQHQVPFTPLVGVPAHSELSKFRFNTNSHSNSPGMA